MPSSLVWLDKGSVFIEYIAFCLFKLKISHYTVEKTFPFGKLWDFQIVPFFVTVLRLLLPGQDVNHGLNRVK